MHLVLIETSGNQDYIFASNKLRQNVGASELVWRVGDLAQRLAEGTLTVEMRDGAPQLGESSGGIGREDWLRGVAEMQGGSEVLHAIGEFVERLGGSECQVLVGISGKALVRVPDDATGTALIQAVTLWARTQAPGLEVHGVCMPEDVSEDEPYQPLVNRLHRHHFQVRGEVPSAVHRFQRLPIVADCATSGFPASERISVAGETPQPISAVALAKHKAAAEGLQRLSRRSKEAGIALARSVDELDQLEGVEWLAVVHADGNALGQTFLEFGNCCQSPEVVGYAAKLLEFSTQLNEITQQAFVEGARAAQKQWNQISGAGRTAGQTALKFVPVVPLVLGGDDLTVVCEGRVAIALTIAYLQAFERLSAESPILAQVAAQRRDFRVGRLSASAGVAIVKPHFPFHAAYELSEQLLQRAKTVKQTCPRTPCSAFDFHILRDSSGADLTRVEQQLSIAQPSPSNDDKVALETRLYHRPIVVTPMELLKDGLKPDERQWVESHDVGHLVQAVKALRETASDDDERRMLPNSLMHELRSALFFGNGSSDATLQAAAQTWQEAAFQRAFEPFLAKGLEPRKASLFFQEGQSWSTRLLDAMEIAPFWPYKTHNQSPAP